MNGIHESLLSLAIDIDDLVPLSGNPRVGDVAAIAASLKEFGQVKPIVVKSNDDGTATVIAGNHTVEAARRLGWKQIAAVNLTGMDDKRAITFALTDNRINELGTTNGELLHQAIGMVIDDYPDFMETLGWDAFEVAAMEEHYSYLNDDEPRETGYVPPVLIQRDPEPPPISTTERKSQPSHIEAPSTVDIKDAITRGSVSVGQAGTKAVVQYTLVFDNADQQRRWYDFLRWLRTDAGTDGETTAERLMYFLDAHANF